MTVLPGMHTVDNPQLVGESFGDDALAKEIAQVSSIVLMQIASSRVTDRHVCEQSRCFCYL